MSPLASGDKPSFLCVNLSCFGPKCEAHITADLIHAMRGGSAVSGIRSSPIPVQCQILRSVGPWSSGRKEASIHTAYCDIIQRAERFIVIEQQFLISGASGDDQVLTVPPIPRVLS